MAKIPPNKSDELTLRFHDPLIIKIELVHHIEDPAISQKLDAILARLEQLEEQIRRACAEIVLSEEVRIALEQILTRLRAL